MIKNVSLFLSTFLLVVFIVTSCGGKKLNEVLKLTHIKLNGWQV